MIKIMFSILNIFRASPDDLLASKLCTEKTFYNFFINDLKHCRHEVIIESPFMTQKRVLTLAPVFAKLTKRGIKVIVTTRDPKEHDTYLRFQATAAIAYLKLLGVEVRLLSNHHHRKLAILDKKILWEGSLNILSQNNSAEIMRRIKSKELSNQMLHFIKCNRLF